MNESIFKTSRERDPTIFFGNSVLYLALYAQETSLHT